MKVKNTTAVITGAASGIGRAVAISLAKRGCHLALADVNAEGLAETERLIASNRVRISRHELDVSSREAIAAFPQAVLAAHPGVDLLFNNAGVGLGGTFEQVTEDDFDWLFNINFHAVVRMTRAFMPVLRKSPAARIVNISSIYGIISPPGQTAYSAAKFAVRGFSNSLRQELEGTNIGVTVVHPGGVATSIGDNSRMSESITEEDREQRRARLKKFLKLPPAEAGEIIVGGVEKGAARILVGSDAKRLALIERLMPVSNWSLIQRLLPK